MFEGLKRLIIEYWMVLLLCIVCALAYDHHHSMFKPPVGKHSWRQADAYSITLNYYMEDRALLEPAMHFQDSKDGKGAGEFTGLYYITSKIWNLTGEQYWVSRFLNYGIFIGGLLFLYRLTRHLTSSKAFGLAVVGVILASPLIGFYGNSFLVNVVALSLMFIAWYYYFHVFEYLSAQDKNEVIRISTSPGSIWKTLIAFVFFASLSGLLRSTMLIGLIPIFVLHFLQLLESRFNRTRLFTFLILFVPVLLVLGWVFFVKSYNASNGSNYFLTQTRPLWGDLNATKVWLDFLKFSVHELYPIHFVIVLIGCTLLALYRSFKINWKIGFSYLSLVGASLMYFILWYGNFDHHDYYMIEFLLLLPPTLWLLYHLYSGFEVKYLKRVLKFSFFIYLIIVLLPFSLTKTRMKYNTGDAGLWSIYLEEEEFRLWEYYEWVHKTKFEAYYDIRKLMRKNGIDRTDLVASLGDPTPNFTLSLMDCKGYTDLYLENTLPDEQLDQLIAKGAKYLMVNTPELKEKLAGREDLSFLFEHRNINVFMIRK